ncbi:MAG: GNAT family N-acetyltransferase [Candidatus Omnitrophica bacterium]|nr:GNAT family N-acetyltransferase [Candidatus Omnitrophota bacterium]
MNKICDLVLDSRLAKAKVGKIIIDNGHFDQAFLRRGLKTYDLIYVFSQMDPEVLASFTSFDWVFAGVRIAFQSKLHSVIFPRIALTSKDFFKASDKTGLIDLAQDLFKQSRFHPDPHTHRLGKNIYTEWIKNSMSGQAADTILVCRNLKGAVIGFVSVKKNNGFFEPVLLKVSDRYQGKGYGKKLMHKFFNYAASKDPRSPLLVNAMLHNTRALNFYHSLNLKVHDEQHVYHVYPKGFRNF